MKYIWYLKLFDKQSNELRISAETKEMTKEDALRFFEKWQASFPSHLRGMLTTNKDANYGDGL